MLKYSFRKTYLRAEVTGLADSSPKPEVPDGMWIKCGKCGAIVYSGDVRQNLYVCPKCGGYFRIHAYRRIHMLADRGSFREWNRVMPVINPIAFPGYEEKLSEAKERTGLDEAIVTGQISLQGNACAIAVCDARFMMSSMGHNFGEKLTLAIEKAAEDKMPLVVFACSGGARMQEGLVSLTQMTKTSAALRKLREAGQVFISVLTDPTMGGVTASFAMLGDVILAEPRALIGFAGPRVIAQTIGERLPKEFQRAEFLSEHGFVDAVVERKDLKETLSFLIRTHKSNPVYPEKPYIPELPKKARSADRPAWDTVLLSRKSDRPGAMDYINRLFPDFMELRGDRHYADDEAIVGGIALFHGIPVTVIGERKGGNLKERKRRNFGMPMPEGYRKAVRLLRQAEAFKRPVICFVDTPGAYCGVEAEERGQGAAIAECLRAFSGAEVPALSILIGEGGSGGALALATADEVWVMENAIYSILSPEGFASILYKDAGRCKEAAGLMRITASDLLSLGVAERIIPEPDPADAKNVGEIAEYMDGRILDFLCRKKECSPAELIEGRYQRFRRF